MKEYFETKKQDFMEQIVIINPEVKEKLEGVFSEVFDSAFEEFETNGVSPDSREQFWCRLSGALSDCGCCQYAYPSLANKAAAVYQETENLFLCWPPQKDMIWKENADYITIQRQGEAIRDKFFTLILPAEPQSLQSFLCKNGLDKPWECRILGIHMADQTYAGLRANLYDCGSVMEINCFFHCFSQLPEEEKRRYVAVANVRQCRRAKDLINLTANMDNLHVVEGIAAKEELGKFLVEDELTSVYFPDETLPFLDYKKIAEAHMEQTGGRIYGNVYAEEAVPQEQWAEIYDGVHIPDFRPEQKAAQETEPETGIETEDEAAEEKEEEAQGFGTGMTL